MSNRKPKQCFLHSTRRKQGLNLECILHRIEGGGRRAHSFRRANLGGRLMVVDFATNHRNPLLDFLHSTGRKQSLGVDCLKQFPQGRPVRRWACSSSSRRENQSFFVNRKMQGEADSKVLSNEKSRLWDHSLLTSHCEKKEEIVYSPFA
jgi:hypothetical protein